MKQYYERVQKGVTLFVKLFSFKLFDGLYVFSKGEDRWLNASSACLLQWCVLNVFGLTKTRHLVIPEPETLRANLLISTRETGVCVPSTEDWSY